MNEQRGGIPPINRQTLWVKRLPDTVIETQVIYVLLEAHTDIDVLQTLYSMWTYDGTWHLMTGENVIAITVTQIQYETLVTNNLLITGQQYLISDLTFTYNIGGTVIPATYIEPLLVTALNNNTLLPIAYPINHPNDYVEVDWSKPEITFRHDLLLNNHIGYDYRNKLNRRYKFNVSNIFNPTYPHVQGDVVIDGNDNIYIAVKNNSSTALNDGNWFKFPFKNGTYSAISNNNMFVVYGTPYYISANILDFVDGLTFRNTVNNVTTGSNFFNNVFFNTLETSTFGDLNSYITSTDSNSYLHFGNNNSHIDINNCVNLTIGNGNDNLILDMVTSSIIGNNTFSIYITNGSIMINLLTINACNSITISNYSNNIIITKTLQYSIIESHINNFISTVDTIDLHIKPNINLVNLTNEVLNLLPLGFHKTIENMFIEGGVKPMLYYMDADSSLPILVEIQ